MAAPLPVCYLNGRFLPIGEARISPLDRGFLFADGVYEVVPVYGGRPFRYAAHAARLRTSLAGLRMEDPHTDAEWRTIIGRLIADNGGGDQSVYWQVTRGAEHGRNHAPLPELPRTVFAFCAPFPAAPARLAESGVECITAADTRWARCDLKSVALLANVLLKQLAVDAGVTETILLREGQLTEGSSSGVHVVLDGVVVTPPASGRLLPGTTHSAVEELAARIGLRSERRAVSEAQLRGADEIWISAALREVQPVTRLDGQPVGTGRPGPLWQRLHAALGDYKRELSGTPW